MGKKIQPKQVEKVTSFLDLFLKEGRTALETRDRDLFYTVYGKVQAAYMFGAINADQYFKFNTEIVVFFNNHESEFKGRGVT